MFYNQTYPDENDNPRISPWTNQTDYIVVPNTTCEDVLKAEVFNVKVNKCNSEVEEHSYPVLNTLFPYDFSFKSLGGLFRSLVFFRGRLYWLENTPVLRYRYLEELTDPQGNYSDKWIDATVDEKEGLPQQFYFASAFVFPKYGNYLDQVYFLLLPKNFTYETEAVYRKVKTMLPLTFYPEVCKVF